MSHIMVDANLDSLESTLELRELLDNDCAEIYPQRLRQVAMRTKNATGIMKLTARRLTEHTRYRGDALLLREALITVGSIIPKPDLGPDMFYLAGWEVNDNWFAKQSSRAAYMRDYRRKKREEAEALEPIEIEQEELLQRNITRDVTRNSYVTPPQSQSQSQSLNELGAHAQHMIFELEGVQRFCDSHGISRISKRSEQYGPMQALGAYSLERLAKCLEIARSKSKKPTGGLLAKIYRADVERRPLQVANSLRNRNAALETDEELPAEEIEDSPEDVIRIREELRRRLGDYSPAALSEAV